MQRHPLQGQTFRCTSGFFCSLTYVQRFFYASKELDNTRRIDYSVYAPAELGVETSRSPKKGGRA